jgi:serine/threonine protein kinase
MLPDPQQIAKPPDPRLISTRTFDGDSHETPGDPLSPTDTASLLPERIGRFQIRRQLGQGGYGSVFLAYDPVLDREIALKVPLQKNSWSNEKAEKFVREARIAARLKHPRVITIYDADSCENQGVFIAMEYVEGETLAQRLKRGRLSVAETVRLCSQVAEAIQLGHRLGLVHRDLKPSNILLDVSGDAKVADFGLALDEERQRSEGGDVSGTWPYMSPEQIRGQSHRLDGRSDLWSLGVIMYECLSGRRPFRGQTWDEIRAEILERDPKPLRQIDESIPAALDELCQQCLQRDLTKRIRSAADFRRELRRLSGWSVWRDRRIVLPVVGTLLLVAFVVALSGPRFWQTSAPAIDQHGPSAENLPEQGDKAAVVVSDGPSQGGQSVAENSTGVHSLVGSKRPGDFRGQILEDGTHLQAETSSVELLALGKLQGDDSCEVDLGQVRWTGGIGFFFGHRSVVHDGEQSRVFQAVVIEPYGDSWLVARNHYNYPLSDPKFWRGEGLNSFSLGTLPNRSVKVQVKLLQGRVSSVAIDGRPLEEPPDVASRTMFDASNGEGDFGLLLDHSGGSASRLKLNGDRKSFTFRETTTNDSVPP